MEQLEPKAFTVYCPRRGCERSARIDPRQIEQVFIKGGRAVVKAEVVRPKGCPQAECPEGLFSSETVHPNDVQWLEANVDENKIVHVELDGNVHSLGEARQYSLSSTPPIVERADPSRTRSEIPNKYHPLP